MTLPNPAHRRRIEGRLEAVAGGCLVCSGSVSSKRHWYKVVLVGGKRYNLRRLLYAYHHGLHSMPPKSTTLKMKCNNPACYNPAHMEVQE